jgi:Zn-dependent M32 family carboxypeptidase
MSKKRFTLNGSVPKSLRDIARDVVFFYARKHPTMTAQEIRDFFVNACSNVRIEHIVETEAEYHARDGQKSQKWTAKEVRTPLGEKLYVSTQWRAKRPNDNFNQFKSIVNRRRWGKIVKII